VIRFTLRAEPPVRIAVDALLPERLASLSASEIERLPLMLGNRRAQVAEWFRVEGSPDETVEIVGPCRRIDRIGAGMTRGSIAVKGNAGAYLGLGMRGGSIAVAGSAGFGAATALSGGVVRISGDAADGLAGALPGAVGGMTGGTVLLGGSAGAFVGQRLRRGLVVIRDGAGAGCGSEMIAGTIIIGGRLGADLGTAMRRGSILALGGTARIGPTFVDCGVHDLVWLCLLRRHLEALGETLLAQRIQPLRRFAGDAAVAGRGELLVPL
jgi:formylmethanofuran dehydrogenase subunit C